MATTNYASVDDYLAAQPQDARWILERVRTTIRKAIPKADELISYQIPTYKVGGKTVVHFAGWKKHFSVYPATQTMLADIGDDLVSYKIEKGTIRFEFSEPIPWRLIARIAKHRANEVAARAAVEPETTKPSGAKKARAVRGKQ